MWSRHSCRTLLREAFADCIGSGSVIRRLENLDGTRRRHSGKTGSKLAIIIANQILWCLPIRGSFPKLLRYPRIGGKPCHSHLDHPPRLELDDEKRKERSKEEICDLQEVASPDLCGVIVYNGCPLLASWLGSANSPHVLLNGSLAHMNTEFQ
jgi:hypothetical protein